MENYQDIELTIEGALARITLSRPKRVNALSIRAISELTRAAHYLDSRDEVRVVIITGKGRAFSAGVDVMDFAANIGDLSKPDRSRIREMAENGKKMVDAVSGMKAITVGSARGCVIGGGMLLMTACDLRIATEETSFAVPELAMGIPFTWGGLPRLQRELGPGLTRDLLLTSRSIKTEEIAATGFIHRVVTDDELEAETAALVETLLEQPPLPFRMTKLQLVQGENEALPDGAADVDRFLESILDPGFMPAAMKYMQRLQLKRAPDESD